MLLPEQEDDISRDEFAGGTEDPQLDEVADSFGEKSSDLVLGLLQVDVESCGKGQKMATPLV